MCICSVGTDHCITDGILISNGEAAIARDEPGDYVIVKGPQHVAQHEVDTWWMGQKCSVKEVPKIPTLMRYSMFHGIHAGVIYWVKADEITQYLNETSNLYQSC